MKIKIGKLIEMAAKFKKVELKNNKEINVSDLEIYIPTPTGKSLIEYVIKKEHLKGIRIKLKSGKKVKCANNHVLRMNNTNVYANTLKVGDYINTTAGSEEIEKIDVISDTTYYDIGIPYPHLYFDDQGILHHNTIVTAALSYLVEPYGRSIVIVPNKSLVEQTEEDYINMGLDVGVFYGKRKEFTKTHTICTWQSLNSLYKKTKKGEAPIPIAEFLNDVTCLIVDEAHAAKAESLKSMLTGAMSSIPLRWGLTGTIPKEKFDFQAIRCSIGDVVGKVSASELQKKGILANCHVKIQQLQDQRLFSDYQSELKYLLLDSARLDYMADMISDIASTGNTLVLVDRVQAGQELTSRLRQNDAWRKMANNILFVSGATKSENRKDAYDKVHDASNMIIVATYGVAAVGINIPRIFNLVLIEPGKSFVRVIQSIGRSVRIANDKDFAQIWDFTSSCKFAKRHLTKRKSFYREAEYPFTVEKIFWK